MPPGWCKTRYDGAPPVRHHLTFQTDLLFNIVEWFVLCLIGLYQAPSSHVHAGGQAVVGVVERVNSQD
jgi:hypothetical protein